MPEIHLTDEINHAKWRNVTYAAFFESFEPEFSISDSAKKQLGLSRLRPLSNSGLTRQQVRDKIAERARARRESGMDSGRITESDMRECLSQIKHGPKKTTYKTTSNNSVEYPGTKPLPTTQGMGMLSVVNEASPLTMQERLPPVRDLVREVDAVHARESGYVPCGGPGQWTEEYNYDPFDLRRSLNEGFAPQPTKSYLRDKPMIPPPGAQIPRPTAPSQLNLSQRDETMASPPIPQDLLRSSRLPSPQPGSRDRPHRPLPRSHTFVVSPQRLNTPPQPCFPATHLSPAGPSTQADVTPLYRSGTPTCGRRERPSYPEPPIRYTTPPSLRAPAPASNPNPLANPLVAYEAADPSICYSMIMPPTSSAGPLPRRRRLTSFADPEDSHYASTSAHAGSLSGGTSRAREGSAEGMSQNAAKRRKESKK